MLSLLPTTVGPENESLLQIGVVHLQQSKSSTQCGAYGRWTGPFSHQYHCKLLQTTSSWPVNQQQHQLAYVSHLLANPISHTKIDFFSGNKATKHMTFPKWLTGEHQMVCTANTNFLNPNHCVLEENSAQIILWDIVVSGEMIHSVPRGE